MRNDKGQFVKGTSGNPKGRPTKEREEKYTEILKSAVTYEQFGKIIKKLAEKAERGDLQAAKLVLESLTIPIAKRFEITGAEGGPMQVNQIVIIKPGEYDDSDN